MYEQRAFCSAVLLHASLNIILSQLNMFFWGARMWDELMRENHLEWNLVKGYDWPPVIDGQIGEDLLVKELNKLFSYDEEWSAGFGELLG